MDPIGKKSKQTKEARAVTNATWLKQKWGEMVFRQGKREKERAKKSGGGREAKRETERKERDSISVM